MMLSSTASNLYWIGRYMERAEFAARLVEATVRLGTLAPRPAGRAAWKSALIVTETPEADRERLVRSEPSEIAQHLLTETDNPASVVNAITTARNNARAARDALTREVWETVNRTWLGLRAILPFENVADVLPLVDRVVAESRGFEGAINRMLHGPPLWFMRLGASLERADNTARLLDVKYHLLLPAGEPVGGTVDRDQWHTLLQVASARSAYRTVHGNAVKPWLVADLLIFRDGLPRSLLACAKDTVRILGSLAQSTGRQGSANRAIRERQSRLEGTNIDRVFQGGLHQFLSDFINETVTVDRAVARQFGFL